MRFASFSVIHVLPSLYPVLSIICHLSVFPLLCVAGGMYVTGLWQQTLFDRQANLVVLWGGLWAGISPTMWFPVFASGLQQLLASLPFLLLIMPPLGIAFAGRPASYLCCT